MTTSERLDRIHMLLKTADASLLTKVERLLERSTMEDDRYPLTADQKEILDARLADHNSNPDTGRNWNDIKTELSAKYGV